MNPSQMGEDIPNHYELCRSLGIRPYSRITEIANLQFLRFCYFQPRQLELVVRPSASMESMAHVLLARNHQAESMSSASSVGATDA